MNLLQVGTGAAAIVVVFLLLVVPHEGGHFAVAKLFHVRVHEFSIGVGARLFSFTRGGTLYALRAIPVVGYVRLGGMEPGEFDIPGGFHNRPAHQRLLILLAGPGANFVVASAVMVAVYLSLVNLDPGKVVQIERDSPAYAQGVRPNDSILSVDGRPVRRSQDILAAEQRHPGQPLTIEVRRPDGSRFAGVVRPRYDRQLKRYVIGVSTQVVTPLQAVVTGLTFPATATALIVQATAEVATKGGLFGPQGVTGVIGLGAVTYQVANQGLVNLAELVALLSMAIGLTNLLPIPALDGGRILVVLLEKLRGRPFDRERELAVQRAALVALLALMALLAILDVNRLASGQLIGLK